MVARFSICDTNRLRLAVSNQLAEPAQTELAEHLQSCAQCRDELERLAAGDPWWSDVHEYLLAEAERSTAGGTAQAFRPTSAAAAAAPPPPRRKPTDESRLSFLRPSDDPTKLGRLGAYQITEVLGRGGMGIVLKAFDPALNRFVAIKVLAAELATSAAARKRFAREGQAAAAVVHEHVVPIYAVDTNGELPFLVMAYVSGRSLQERIEETGPLELKEILRIAMQTAQGLAAAHAQGLVHRDIKPANILLENGVERVKITDFGLARAVDDASLTQSGVIAGTPEYMSPEQSQGEPVDHRADLFSLGSVIYAMATGHSPFRAETTMAVLRRICDGRRRTVRELNPDIPDWLADVIDRLHAERPEDRFQSAAEVAELLEKHLADVQQPGSTKRRWIKSRRQSWRRALKSKPRLAIAVLLVAVVVLLCISLSGDSLLEWLHLRNPFDTSETDIATGDESSDSSARLQELRQLMSGPVLNRERQDLQAASNGAGQLESELFSSGTAAATGLDDPLAELSNAVEGLANLWEMPATPYMSDELDTIHAINDQLGELERELRSDSPGPVIRVFRQSDRNEPSVE